MKTIKRIAAFIVFFALAMVMMTSVAFAYIDPAAATLVIQVVAGIVIAIGATVGIFWRKIKRAFSGKRKDGDGNVETGKNKKNKNKDKDEDEDDDDDVFDE